MSFIWSTIGESTHKNGARYLETLLGYNTRRAAR